MNKVCTNCKQEKDESEFYNHPFAKDGKQTQCKKCNARYSAPDYKEKSAEKWAAIQAAAESRLKGLPLKNTDAIGLPLNASIGKTSA